MALIKCPECGKEVSDKAVSCIHCGFPFPKTQEKTTDISYYIIELNKSFSQYTNTPTKTIIGTIYFQIKGLNDQINNQLDIKNKQDYIENNSKRALAIHNGIALMKQHMGWEQIKDFYSFIDFENLSSEIERKISSSIPSLSDYPYITFWYPLFKILESGHEESKKIINEHFSQSEIDRIHSMAMNNIPNYRMQKFEKIKKEHTELAEEASKVVLTDNTEVYISLKNTFKFSNGISNNIEGKCVICGENDKVIRAVDYSVNNQNISLNFLNYNEKYQIISNGEFLIGTHFMYNGYIPNEQNFDAECSLANSKSIAYKFKKNGTFVEYDFNKKHKGHYLRKSNFLVLKYDESTQPAFCLLIHNNSLCGSTLFKEEKLSEIKDVISNCNFSKKQTHINNHTIYNVIICIIAIIGIIILLKSCN